MPLRTLLVCACALTVCAVASKANAHGDWGHIHVTGWAIENSSDGEFREFFRDPEVFNAALFGAAYPDSGYWVTSGDDVAASREFAEHSHWEPFVEDFVQHIVDNYPPPFETLEVRKLVAFMMGCGAHGLQDEIFDSLFLDQVDEHDGEGQDAADAGTDGFLVNDELHRFLPTAYLPMNDLLELYAELPQTVTETIIENAVIQQERLYVSEFGIEVARVFGGGVGAQIPWTAAHYMDPDIPGSLRTEIMPTLKYMEALWDRVHGRFTDADLVVHEYPEAPWRLRSHESGTVDSWVTLVFGKGLHKETPTGSFVDGEGGVVDFDLTGTRWGATYTRLVRFRPLQALAPGDAYTITLFSGAELIDGTTTTESFSHEFQVECTEEDPDVCPDLGEVPLLPIDGSTWSFADDGPSDGDPNLEGSGSGGGCVVSRPASDVTSLVALCLVIVASGSRRFR